MIARTLTLFLIALFLASCNGGKKESPKTTTPEESDIATTVSLSDQQLAAAGIVMGKIEPRVVSGIIKANGVLDVPPQNLVSIAAPLGGFVKNTELLQGMHIAKGQILATLEGPEFIQLQEDYLTNKSQLEYQSKEYDRQKDLAAGNVNAGKTLQLAKATYLATKAKVEGLTAMLKMIHIDPASLESGPIQSSIMLYAPISGFITQVNVNVGMHVNPNDIMFKIVDTGDLHAEAQVFEKDIAGLKIGQHVRVMLSGNPIEHAAKVYLIGREITPDRTVRVHCHFEGHDPELLPGMYFSAVIETDNKTVPAVPDDAVVTFAGKKYLFIQNSARVFELKEIKTGKSESGFTEISAPEKLGITNAAIVVKGSYDLLSKLKNNEN